MSALFGPDLPRPATGELMLYLVGPGVGESMVAIMPDGRVLVVDVCEHAGVNLTLALLDELGAERIDLLVISHPDLDHVRGLAALLAARPPQEVWRYPLEASARDFLTAWAKRTKRTAMSEALEAIGRYARHGEGETFSVALGDRTWPSDRACGYTVHALAPTEYDKERAIHAFNRRLMGVHRAKLDRWLAAVVAGERGFGDSPNVISLALAIEVGERRVVLGGDVLTGTKSPRSGWKGVLRLLRKFGRAHLLTAASAVKVAHHGSRRSHDETLWALHTNDTDGTLALLAPFGPAGLPDAPTLAALRTHARPLLVTAGSPSLDARAAAAGWQPVATSRVARLAAPLVAVRVRPEGVSAYAGVDARQLI